MWAPVPRLIAIYVWYHLFGWDHKRCVHGFGGFGAFGRFLGLVGTRCLFDERKTARGFTTNGAVVPSTTSRITPTHAPVHLLRHRVKQPTHTDTGRRSKPYVLMHSSHPT
jgi:hypothetical protein